MEYIIWFSLQKDKKEGHIKNKYHILEKMAHLTYFIGRLKMANNLNK